MDTTRVESTKGLLDRTQQDTLSSPFSVVHSQYSDITNIRTSILSRGGADVTEGIWNAA